ncbi:MAG TPA: response regulator [Dehalococcoidia bacterium]|nr:response regulator [Dehalococcoidia bacterium]
MHKQAKILLVDDDPDFVEATKTVLESKYQVVIAYNGDDGLKKVVEERPDLIVLDVVMPGKDGFAVCKELKENPHYYFFSDIPVLMLTVFPRGIEQTNIPLSAGVTTEAEGYVQKPVNPEELLSQAEELLKKYG